MAHRYESYDARLRIAYTDASLADTHLATSAQYSGVALISNGFIYGSGSLLQGGRFVLTAAHVANDGGVYKIQFSDGSTRKVKNIYIHPGWLDDANNFNNDVALLELDRPASAKLEQYDLYRNFDELGQTGIRVGYGILGDGNSGLLNSSTGKVKRFGSNVYEATTDQLNLALNMDVSPRKQLLMDFDDGSVAHDALGKLLGIHNLGLGDEETNSTVGDSGGPVFIDGKIAGITSWGLGNENSEVSTDVNRRTDSSFGEISSETRVSAYADWIDHVVKGTPYPLPPDNNVEVDSMPVEVDRGEVVLNYFLIELSEAPQQRVSMNYETVDGTASAGQDYLATSGIAIFEPGQNHFAVPVTLIGDNKREGNETFGLMLSHAQGVDFPDQQITLTVFHTIVDNDGLFF